MDMDAAFDTIHMLAVNVGYEQARQEFDSFVEELKKEWEYEISEDSRMVDKYVEELVGECNALSEKNKILENKIKGPDLVL